MPCGTCPVAHSCQFLQPSGCDQEYTIQTARSDQQARSSLPEWNSVLAYIQIIQQQFTYRSREQVAGFFVGIDLVMGIADSRVALIGGSIAGYSAAIALIYAG